MLSLLRAAVGAAAEQVVEASEPEELPAGCAPSLAVIDAGDDRDFIARAAARLPEGTALLVVLGDAPPLQLVQALAAQPQVVAAVAASRATPSAMASLARRLTGGGAAAARWLPAGAVAQTAQVSSYADKLHCIARLQQDAEASMIRGKYRDAIAECADEILMNALYAAPRAAAAGARVGKQAIAERAARSVGVSWVRAGDTFYLAVRDSWGSLRRDALVDRWAGALAGGGEGGAGLGMSIVAGACTGVHFTVAPGVATECVCTFDLRQGKPQLQEVAVTTETDPDRIADFRRAAAVPVRQPAAAATVPGATRVLLVALFLLALILLITWLLR